MRSNQIYDMDWRNKLENNFQIRFILVKSTRDDGQW